MVTITINGRQLEVACGETILAAARKLGVEIPTLCFLEGYKPITSCMVCVVKDHNSGRIIPSCSALATSGMIIDTDSDEIHRSRKEALEMLLSEHVGDCEGPCQRICPAHMNIPLMMRQISAREYAKAIETIKKDIPFPGICGCICSAPCEKGCRRGEYERPVSICILHRFVAEMDLDSTKPYLPLCKPSTGKKVAIVGSGPTGLSAAYYLLQEGHICYLFDKKEQPGGMLRYGVPKKKLPLPLLNGEIEIVRKLGGIFHMNTALNEDISLEELKEEFDVIVVSIGKIKPGQAKALGLGLASRGIAINPHTFETSFPKIFAGGAVVSPNKMVIKAIASGKAIARSVNQLLHDQPITGLAKGFSSRMRPIQKTDPREPLFLESDVLKGFSKSAAEKESRRCLHCECDKGDSCKLRKYADRYNARQLRSLREGRRVFEHIPHCSVFIYEPGKCIKCGLCVQITEKAGGEFGFTFIGRGFSMDVGIPFSMDVATKDVKIIHKCHEACPTGALALTREQR